MYEYASYVDSFIEPAFGSQKFRCCPTLVTQVGYRCLFRIEVDHRPIAIHFGPVWPF